MGFGQKLQAIRKNSGLSQEGLAEYIGVSRQAVAKWESGQAYPDIKNLIALRDVFQISLDRLLRQDNDTCVPKIIATERNDRERIVSFLCRAKKMTYAAHGTEEEASSRLCSHDLKYAEGEYLYLDTYLGGEKFAGEEAVWVQKTPLWAMNYAGRVLCEPFSGDFLKEVLLHVPESHPYRGPMVYGNGDYRYHCTVNGNFDGSMDMKRFFVRLIRYMNASFTVEV